MKDPTVKTHNHNAAPDEPAVIDRSSKPDETPLWDKFVQTVRVPKVSPPPPPAPPAEAAPKPPVEKKAPVKAAVKKAPAKKAPAKKK